MFPIQRIPEDSGEPGLYRLRHWDRDFTGTETGTLPMGPPRDRDFTGHLRSDSGASLSDLQPTRSESSTVPSGVYRHCGRTLPACWNRQPAIDQGLSYIYPQDFTGHTNRISKYPSK